MPEGKLRLKTLDLLINRPRTLTLKIISEETLLPEPWLKSFLARGAENDAGSDRIVKLYEHLTNRKLKI